MTSTIKIKNSSTAGAVPGSGDLVQGELAVNVTDKKIYTKNASGTVVNLGTTPSITDNGNAEAIVIDSSENVGIGVSPSAWASGSKAINVGAWGAVSSNTTSGNLELTNNAYQSSNAGAFTYVNTQAATRYAQAIGSHQWFNAASGTAGDAISFTLAMTLDASGNLGVGTTSPTSKLTVGDNTAPAINLSDAAGSLKSQLIYRNSTTGNLELTNISSAALVFGTNNTEKARIDSSGNLLVGTTSRLSSGSYGNNEIRASQGNGGAAALVVYETSGVDASTSINAIKSSATTSSSQRFLQFYANAGATAMGGIVGNGASNVQFASLSDAREKTNIQSISGSLSKINALRPVEFDWIADGSHVPAGFVAQEVETVFPEFVVENMSNDGQEERKGLTGGMTGGIIAHLVKAIQEMKTIIDQQAERIAALEAK